MQRVLIIGAGPAGLTAAFELLKRNKKGEEPRFEVIILEESDAIGGISRTVRHSGCRMDIGGHRFFSKDQHVMDWWAAQMPLQGAMSFDDKMLSREKPLSPGGPDPEQTDRVMLIRQRISRIYYLDKFFDYPVSMKWRTIRNMGFMRTLKAGFSYLGAAIAKKPENSLEDFYINRFGRVLYSMFFEGYTEKLWGRHPSGIAADWGAQRVKGLSVRAMLKDMFRKASGKKDAQNTETSLIEEFWYPKFGPGQLWETVADEIEAMGGKIIKNCRVKEIGVKNGRVQAVLCERSGKDYIAQGHTVISSMPIKDLVAGLTGDPVPQDVREIAAGLPYRDFVTIGLLVHRLNLKNETNIPTLGNIVPDCWIYVQDTGVKLGRIQIFNNWSPYMVKDPEHTVWIGLEYFCNEGDDFWNMSEEECISFAAAELEKMGIIREKDVMDAHREKVKKAYPAYFDTYDRIGTVTDYLNGINGLYCVGRNGQHRYNNMDHSMVTAMRAAACIAGEETNKAAIWNVNTEQAYHEEKQENEP